MENAIFRKTGPLDVELIADPGSDAVRVVREGEDGQVELAIKLIYAKQFDERLLARALCKIGLGAVALDFGQDYACSNRFDPVRKFITEGGDFKNNLLLYTWMTLRTDIRTRYDHIPEVEGTIVQFYIYGIMLAINLEEKPLLKMNKMLRKLGFVAFPLFGNRKRPSFTLRMISPSETSASN